MQRNRFGITAALIAGVIAVIGASAMAESIWIKSEVVDIRTGKGAVYPVIAKAKKGQELTVIGHEGKWIKVAIPPATAGGAPQEGYVFQNAASATKVNGGAQLMTTGTSSMSTGAAAKGLQPSAENYAAGKQLDSGPLNRLIAMRDKIDPKELAAFMAAGHVGVQ